MQRIGREPIEPPSGREPEADFRPLLKPEAPATDLESVDRRQTPE